MSRKTHHNFFYVLHHLPVFPKMRILKSFEYFFYDLSEFLESLTVCCLYAYVFWYACITSAFKSNNSIWKPQQITNKWHQKPMNHILWKFLYIFIFFFSQHFSLSRTWLIYLFLRSSFYFILFFFRKRRSKAGNFALFLAVSTSSIYQANT